MYDISIIIPAYNEAERITPTLQAFATFLRATCYSYEILVIDDGSTDQTARVVDRLRQTIPELVIRRLKQNRGKGGAVKYGMLSAGGRVRIFADADGSTPVEELDKLLAEIFEGKADIAIGSRYLEHSHIEVAQSWPRRKWSRFANQIVQRSVLPGIVDPQSGFKAFTADAASKLFSELKTEGWAFDLEILVTARNEEMKISEVPVRWTNDTRSKGRTRDLPRELHAFYAIRKQAKNRAKST